MKSPFRSAEQVAYSNLIQQACRPGPPLLAGGAPGLGKTHGYTFPLIQSGLKVAVAMSTRQLIEQYLSSSALQDAMAIRPASVIALQTREAFDSDRAYREHKEEALAADVLVLTHMGAFIDVYFPSYANLRGRDVVLFDEADLLADAADLRSTFELSAKTLEEFGAANKPHAEAAQTVKDKTDNPEDKAAASAILRALENPAWYKVVGKEEDGALLLKHRMPGRMLRQLVEDVPRTIFTSGTLQVSGRFDHFTQALGLKNIAPESRHIDPSQHGVLKVFVVSEEMDIAAQARRIQQASRPTLVLTTSHSQTAALAELCPEATTRGKAETLVEAVKRCPDDGVLIAAGAWSGLDDPRLRWKTVVIPKTPYAKPAVLDNLQVSRYVDSEVVAIRRTNQGLHRGLRTPDAECTLLLLDPRSARQKLRQAIPTRFRVEWDSWAEGDPKVRLHMEMENKRNSSVRNQAIKVRGQQCEETGCQVTALHLLDVHHTSPIALGPRQTTIADLRVLCKNHHAEAHHRMKEQDLNDEKE